MKSIARLLSRALLLLLAAAGFVWLTQIYGANVRTALPSPHDQAARLHRPSAPQPDEFLEFVGVGIGFAIFVVGGRLLLRLRLSRVPGSEGQPVLLDLDS